MHQTLGLTETMYLFCLAGSAQRAQQSIHLAECLTKLIICFFTMIIIVTQLTMIVTLLLGST